MHWYWQPIYPDKWEEENYQYGMGEMFPQRAVIMRAGVKVAEKYVGVSSSDRTDPLFYSAVPPVVTLKTQ